MVTFIITGPCTSYCTSSCTLIAPNSPVWGREKIFETFRHPSNNKKKREKQQQARETPLISSLKLNTLSNFQMTYFNSHESLPGSKDSGLSGAVESQDVVFPINESAAASVPLQTLPQQQLQQIHSLTVDVHHAIPDNDLPQDPVKITSNFVGVHWHRGANKWVAQISLENKRTHLGYFKTEIEAAVRYDKTAYEHGRPLNFPPMSQENSELLVKQASKSNNAIVVGASNEYTKGPYKKREPGCEKKLDADGELDNTAVPKQKRKRGPNKNKKIKLGGFADRQVPLAAMEPVSFKPFNQDTIVQALLNQAAMESAAPPENREPEFEKSMALMKDPRVAGFLMEMETSNAAPSNEIQDTSNSKEASKNCVVLI